MNAMQLQLFGNQIARIIEEKSPQLSELQAQADSINKQLVCAKAYVQAFKDIQKELEPSPEP